MASVWLLLYVPRSQQKHFLTLSLIQGRVHMEVHALMAYGSAAKSMQLLWQYELLDFFFPLLAEYLTERKYPRCKQPLNRERI